MTPVGYARLVEWLRLNVRAPLRTALIASSVNRRIDNDKTILFPSGVALDDTVLGHLEFALRHEGVNLEVIDAVFEHLPPADLIARLKATPTGEQIRRACFLWEWLTGQTLETDVSVKGKYVDLFPADLYYTAAVSKNAPKFRVKDNALGTPAFCPIVRRTAVALEPSLDVLLAQAQQALVAVDDPALYQRALTYLYLSETRGSYAIEKETPNSSKQERFVELLKHAGDTATVSEEWLVELQNVIVRDVYSQEASYRVIQNWLEDAMGRVSFIPAPINDLQYVMRGWETFINDRERCTDVLLKTACAAFGFVYLHPFLDGNGRLHRFLIQHVLARSALMAAGIVIPVSAVIEKCIPAYLDVLQSFSEPVTALWEYERGDSEPRFVAAAGSRSYRFFEADREVAFLHAMVKQAVDVEIPQELSYLRGYDLAYSALNKEFDLPQNTLSALIRQIQSNRGVLSNNTRKKYPHLPIEVMERITEIIRESFDIAKEGQS